MEDFSKFGTLVEEQPKQSGAVPDFSAQGTSVDQLARDHVLMSSGTDTAQVQRSIQLSRQLGVPQPAVEADIDTYSDIADVDARRRMVESHEKLRNWIAQNPVNAKASADDFENLGKIEQILTGLGRSFELSSARTLEGLKMQYADLVGDKAILDQAKRDTQIANQIQDESTPQFDSTAGRWIYGGAQGLVNSAPGLMATYLNPAAGIAMFGGQAEAEGYGKYRTRGGSAGEALTGGAAEGAVMAATSFIPLSYVSESLGKVGMTKFLANLLGRDVASMEVQTLANSAIDTAVANPDKTFGDWAKELPENVGQAAVAALMFSGAMSGMHGIVKFAQREDHQNAVSNDQHQQLDALNKVVKATPYAKADPEGFKQFIKTVTEDGNLSNVYVDGDAFRQAVEKSGKTIAEVQAQMPDVNITEAVATNGIVRIPIEDYAAHVAGEDIGAALLDHLKTEPDGKTYAEVRGDIAAEGEQMADKAKELSAEKEQETARKASVQAVHDDILRQLNDAGVSRPEVNKQYAKVRSEIFGRIADKLKISPEEAYRRYGARIVAEDLQNAKQQAYSQNTGEENDLDYTNSRTTSGGLRSESGRSNLRTVGGEAPRDGWVTATRAAREGRPLVLYRGASNTLEAEHFKPENLGYASGNPSSGLGVFLTSHKAEAAKYGSVEQHHLDIRNPKIIKLEDLPAFDTTAEATAYRENLRRQGYDGLVLTGKHLGKPEVHFVAFDPHQVIPTKGGEFYQPAYHGSPYKFDKFSLEHMGKGEGAQAYGWGLYFAGNRNVAEFYKSQLAEPPVIKEWKFGTAHLIKDGEYRDYSPRDGSDQQQARALLSEDMLMEENTIRQAWEKGGIEGARKEMLRIADERIALAKEDQPSIVSHLKVFRNRIEKELKFDVDTSDTGQVYKVDIPEDDTFLDWDKPLSEQPEKVKAALGKGQWDHSGIIGYWMEKSAENTAYNGDDLYQRLAGTVGSPEAASKYLHSLGINGIRYLDGSSRSAGEGHHNYVVFDDNTIKVLETYYQGLPQDTRGYYSPSARLIGLTKNADLSTFIHETGHEALEVYSRIATGPDAPAEIRSDMDKILSWMGIKGSDQVKGGSKEGEFDQDKHSQGGPRVAKTEPPKASTALEVWNKMSLEEQRPYHEQFARGMEAYFMEGKAPSLELQPVFARVKAWMMNIYRQLSNLNVELTDEVRGVFDRMLASEDAIKEAESARGYWSLFREKPEDVSQSEWDDYQAIGKAATLDAMEEMQLKSLKDMKWLSGAKSKALKDLQKQADAARREVRAEAEKDVSEMPVYRLQDWVRENKVDLEKADIDAVADELGYPSGEAAKKALLEAKPREDAIRELTDRRMLEEHGELSNSDAIERAAEAAIHNAARARFMATGLKMLTKSPIPVRQLVKGAKEAAYAAISAKKIADVRPKLYEAAESKNNKDAIKLAAKKPEEAVTAQRAALLNNQLAKAAQEAQSEVQKALDYFKRMEKSTAQERMRGESRDQINALLGRFDLRKSATQADLKPISEWIKNEADRLSAVMPDLPEWVLNDGYRTHYTELTVDQMRGLYDSIKQLEKMARREHEQYMAVRNMDFAEERGQVLDEIRKNWANAFDEDGQPKEQQPDFVPSIKKTVSKLGDKFAGEFLSPETIMSILGGGKFTVVNESLFGRISSRSDWKSTRMEGIYKELKPLFEQYSIKEKMQFSRKDISTKEGLPVAMTRENALVVALLHGSKDGRERLKNYGWDEAFQKRVIDLLDERDMKLADAIWRIFDDNLWPELKELNDRTRGKSPSKVEALPYQTKYGTARGGYFKLKYDTNLDERMHRLDEGQSVKELLGGGLGMSSKTNQGSSTERVQGVKARPRLDLGVFAEAVNETVHDLAYREAIADTIRMLNDKKVMASVKQIVGTEGYRALLNRVREVAAPPRNPSGFVEKTISIARKNTVINLMSGVKTALQNFTGLAPAFAEINAGTLGAELTKFYSSKMMDRYEFCMQQSEFMRHRFTSFDRDLQNMASKLTVNGKYMPDESTFLGLMGIVDKGVSVPVWNAAFKQGMERFENDHKKAVDYADHVVRQTQGSGREVDLPSIMSGHGGWGQLKRAFTMFYSYFNGQLNLLVRQGVIGKIEARENPSLAAAKFTAKFMAIVVTPAILTEMLMHGVQNDGEDDKDMFVRYLGSLVKYGAGFVPFVRDVVPGIWSQFAPNEHFYGAKLTPIDSSFETAIKATKSMVDIAAGEGDEKDTKNLILGTGFVLGLPGKLVSDTTEGTRQWLNGETGPEAIVLVPTKK